MSSTLLEVTRSAHEDVERLERLIVRELQREPDNSRDRLFQSHRVRHMIDLITNTTDKLIDVYEDKDSARKDEIAALGGQTATGATTLFGAFYDRLKEIRDYHRRHPSARVVDTTEEYEELLKEEPHIEFSGEEAFGRYLDMHELYNEYINSKFGDSSTEYLTFLDSFSQTQSIPFHLKLSRQYKEYLEHVLQYLVSFMERTQPLQDLNRLFEKLEVEFEQQWADGKVLGWENKGLDRDPLPSQSDELDLEYYSTLEELMEVGPEKLKEALAALGLKTGGTLKQRAERLFLTKNTPLEQLDRKHFAKSSRNSEKNVATDQISSKKEIALMEAKLHQLCSFKHFVIDLTKENIEKKQALTYEEMEAEREEEVTQADSESDDEEQQIYNPLKLPMGWDGKPIPYWLYKLHGLGQEFKCEICGNQSYWGRRAFERHFKEWRHQHGMRCLNIPNTKNFNEITSIQEAKELWEKIQERQGVNKWRPDLEEEYEDREGNIYNKKTYTDLQRQGLI
ncbi:splicing factor SF3a60 homolog [Zingiber officinale]|uniref:splicing factor SF3a60 homolog n=1 Tax=Zingiber officinale TaxID=94328 RepID=UPI001C4CDF31|nr:splicing factor SF3a60 homolog [Zingiber officinale]